MTRRSDHAWAVVFAVLAALLGAGVFENIVRANALSGTALSAPSAIEPASPSRPKASIAFAIKAKEK